MHPTRAQILSTAPAVFAESGFAGTSTRQLAAAAGCNIATLAYHFGGKQGLYEAVIDHVYGALLDAPLPDLEALSRRERPRAFKPSKNTYFTCVFQTFCKVHHFVKKSPNQVHFRCPAPSAAVQGHFLLSRPL